MTANEMYALLNEGFGLGPFQVLLAALAGSLALSWPLLQLVKKANGTIPPPDDNPSHDHGLKYGYGGIGVAAVGVLVSVAAMGIHSEWRPALLFALGLFLIGLLDDSHPLTPGWKVILQVPLALMTVLWLPRPSWMPYGMPWVLAATAWLTVMTNAYNILDVVDGMLASIVPIFLTAVGLMLWGQGETHLAVMALAFAGAAAGFLPMNAWPSRQVLGDSGSLPLGGICALLIMYVDVQSIGPTGWVMVLLLVAIPLFEVTWVSIRRIGAGIPPWRRSPHHLVFWMHGRFGTIRWSVAGLAMVQTVPLVMVSMMLSEVDVLALPALILAVMIFKPIVLEAVGKRK